MSEIFTRLLPLHSHVKVPKGIPSSVTTKMLLDFFSVTTSSFLTFACSRMSTERKVHDVCAAEKVTLLFEQHNEQFANQCEYRTRSDHRRPSHAFHLLVKFLTALGMIGLCCKLSQIDCSTFLSSSKNFGSGGKRK